MKPYTLLFLQVKIQFLLSDANQKGVWKEAMKDEIKSIEENQTWELTELPPHKKSIGVKWVYKTKMNPDGTINKHKARLVTKGYKQKEGEFQGGVCSSVEA